MTPSDNAAVDALNATATMFKEKVVNPLNKMNDAAMDTSAQRHVMEVRVGGHTKQGLDSRCMLRNSLYYDSTTYYHTYAPCSTDSSTLRFRHSQPPT